MPTKIIFGCGKAKTLKAHIPHGISNILVVTDPTSFQESGARQLILEQLVDYTLRVFDEVEENPSFESLEKGAALARETQTQLIIGVGGGSPMDAAKGIATLAVNGGSMKEYIEEADFESEPLPVICLSTTSGTGSEVTPYAVFTDLEQGKKMCLAHPKIYPQCSIVDPELTYSMPESICVNTGLDALSHAMEACLSTISHPMIDALAFQSMQMVLDNLEDAANNQKGARNIMAYASMLAGICISQTSTILLHIMAYPLTIYHGIPHGKANAILMPAFLRFMEQRSTSTEKLDRILAIFAKRGGAAAFISNMGIDCRLASYGITPNSFEKFASDTIVKDDIHITPAKVTKQDIIDLYNHAYT